MWRFTSYCHCTCSFRLSQLFQACTPCLINFVIVDQSTALMLQANITSHLIDSPVWEWLWLSPSHVPSLHFLCRRGMSANIEHIKWGLDGWFKIRPCSIMIESWLFFLFSNAAQNKRVIKITGWNMYDKTIPNSFGIRKCWFDYNMIMTTAELWWPESCPLLWEGKTIWDTSFLNKFK